MAYNDLVTILESLELDLSPIEKRIVHKLDFKESVLPGSHIAVPSSRNSSFGPWHHGILVDTNSVIHMFGVDKIDAKIRMCSVKEFTAGTDLVAVVMYEDDDDSHRQATVKAAQGMLEMFGRKPEPMYDIRGFNCEHFAVLCRHGLSRTYSQQVMKVYEMLQPAMKTFLEAVGRSIVALAGF